MALPKQLERVIGKIAAQTDVEKKLVSVLTRRLENSLGTLRKLFGSECAEDSFAQLVDCALKEGTSSCFDEYEEYVTRCIASRLRRLLTESEEELVGELLGHITGIAELLMTLGGVQLTDTEEEEEPEGQ